MYSMVWIYMSEMSLLRSITKWQEVVCGKTGLMLVGVSKTRENRISNHLGPWCYCMYLLAGREIPVYYIMSHFPSPILISKMAHFRWRIEGPFQAEVGGFFFKTTIIPSLKARPEALFKQQVLDLFCRPRCSFDIHVHVRSRRHENGVWSAYGFGRDDCACFLNALDKGVSKAMREPDPGMHILLRAERGAGKSNQIFPCLAVGKLVAVSACLGPQRWYNWV